MKKACAHSGYLLYNFLPRWSKHKIDIWTSLLLLITETIKHLQSNFFFIFIFFAILEKPRSCYYFTLTNYVKHTYKEVLIYDTREWYFFSMSLFTHFPRANKSITWFLRRCNIGYKQINPVGPKYDG